MASAAGVVQAQMQSPPQPMPLARTHAGTTTSGLFGSATANLGDLTGDGVPEYAIGAPGHGNFQVPAVLAGRVFVYNGATGRELVRPGLLNLGGSMDGDLFGRSVAGLGDATGDGIPDFAVGGNGFVRVLNGATFALHAVITPLPPVVSNSFGWTVAGIGDINGDGRGDIAVGAPAAMPGGVVQVFSGANGAALGAVAGVTPQGQLGYAIAGIGDYDLDGVDDVAIGSNVASTVEVHSGFALANMIAAPIATFSLSAGPTPGPSLAQFGAAITRVGDWNLDGRQDFAVGTNFGNEVRVYAGGSASYAAPLRLLTASAFLYMGRSLSGGLDYDGDGVGDLAVGDCQPASGGLPSVRVYSGASGLVLRSIRSTSNDAFGQSLSLVPSIDAGGRAELLVGAPNGAAAGAWYPGYATLFFN